MLGIGLDIGTTSVKGLLFSKEGALLQEAFEHVETLMPQENYREQDPQLIFEAVLNIIQKLSLFAQSQNKKISFVSFSAYMHSLIVVDKNDQPLTHCILWSDNRSIEFSQKYQVNGIGLQIYKKTGTPIHPMSPLYKIMFLKEKYFDIFSAAKKFISIKEFIFYKLFGVYAVDFSIASATGMFDIFELEWSALALQELQITKEHLSHCYNSDKYFTGVRKNYAQQMSVDSSTKFVLGASDGCLANLGSKGTVAGTGVVSIGTSGAIRVVSDQPVIDNLGRTFSYLLQKGVYVSGGAINNGAIVYDWFNQSFINDMNKTQQLLQASQEGMGPLFLPFLTGERAPYWDSQLRGMYFGIDSSHTQKEFLRSSIEGVCYAIADVYLVLKETLADVSVFYANGGFTKSNIWVQTLANILGKNIVVSQNYQASALGAFMLGLLSLGEFYSFKDMDFLLQDGSKFYPQKEMQLLHNKRFELYKKIIRVNQELFASLKP